MTLVFHMPVECILYTYLVISYLIGIPIARSIDRCLKGEDSRPFAGVFWLFSPISVPGSMIIMLFIGVFQVIFYKNE